MREVIELLRKRIGAETATLLVKVKARNGEPTNERAHIQADKTVSSKITEWDSGTNRAIFTWKKPRRKEGRIRYNMMTEIRHGRAVCAKRVRRGETKEDVRKYRDRITGALRQISRQRRKANVSYERGTMMIEILQKGTWMDEESLGKTCVVLVTKCTLLTLDNPRR